MIDFHIHTTCSDGEKSIEEIIKIANEENLKAISITDHDFLYSKKRIDLVRAASGMEIIPGCEITCLCKKNIVHILAYFVTKESSLHKIIEEYKKINLRNYIDSKKKDINVVKWISVDVEKVINEIKIAGGVSVLAHPDRYKMSEMELETTVQYLKNLGLDGIECYRNEYDEETVCKFEKIAQKYELITTCGSDYHKSTDSIGVNCISKGKCEDIILELCTIHDIYAHEIEIKKIKKIDKIIPFYNCEGTYLFYVMNNKYGIDNTYIYFADLYQGGRFYVPSEKKNYSIYYIEKDENPWFYQPIVFSDLDYDDYFQKSSNNGIKNKTVYRQKIKDVYKAICDGLNEFDATLICVDEMYLPHSKFYGKMHNKHLLMIVGIVNDLVYVIDSEFTKIVEVPYANILKSFSSEYYEHMYFKLIKLEDELIYKKIEDNKILGLVCDLSLDCFREIYGILEYFEEEQDKQWKYVLEGLRFNLIFKILPCYRSMYYVIKCSAISREMELNKLVMKITLLEKMANYFTYMIKRSTLNKGYIKKYLFQIIE